MNNRAHESELIAAHRRLERRAGLPLKLAVLLSAGSAALSGCAAQGPELTPPPTTVETVAPTPEASAAPEQEITTEAFEIPGNLSPEDAVTVFVNQRLSAWFMAGATQETIDGYYAAGGSSDFMRSVAEDNAAVIADALFVPDWRGNDELAHYVDFEADKNATMLELWFLTRQSGKPIDREPFERTIDIDSIDSAVVDGDSVALSVSATERDNRDQNSVREQTSETFMSPDPITGDITLQKVDDTWRVAAIDWSARQ